MHISFARTIHNIHRGNVLDERQVGNGSLPSNKPLLLGQHAVEHAEHARYLVLVTLNRARNLLAVELGKPGILAEVRALSGHLEAQPLELLVPVGLGGGRDFVVRVVLVDEVRQNRGRLPVRCSIR